MSKIIDGATQLLGIVGAGDEALGVVIAKGYDRYRLGNSRSQGITAGGRTG